MSILRATAGRSNPDRTANVEGEQHEIQRGFTGPRLRPSPGGRRPAQHDGGGVRPRARGRAGSGLLRGRRRRRHEPGGRSRRHPHRRGGAPLPRPDRSHTRPSPSAPSSPTRPASPSCTCTPPAAARATPRSAARGRGSRPGSSGRSCCVEIIGTGAYAADGSGQRVRTARTAVSPRAGAPRTTSGVRARGLSRGPGGRTTAAPRRAPAPRAATAPSAGSRRPKAAGRPSRAGRRPPPPIPGGRGDASARRRPAAASRLPPQHERGVPGRATRGLLNGAPRSRRARGGSRRPPRRRPADHRGGSQHQVERDDHRPYHGGSTIEPRRVAASAGRNASPRAVRPRRALQREGGLHMSRPPIALVLARRRSSSSSPSAPLRAAPSTNPRAEGTGSTPPRSHVQFRHHVHLRPRFVLHHAAGRIHLPPHRTRPTWSSGSRPGGGFVPIEYNYTMVPEFTLYGDGRIIVTGPITMRVSRQGPPEPADDRRVGGRHPGDAGRGQRGRTVPERRRLRPARSRRRGHDHHHRQRGWHHLHLADLRPRLRGRRQPDHATAAGPRGRQRPARQAQRSVRSRRGTSRSGSRTTSRPSACSAGRSTPP